MMEYPTTFVLDEAGGGLPGALSAAATSANEQTFSDDVLLDAYSRTVTRVVDQVGPSVVRLDITRGNGDRGGSGSGVIVSPDGLILTNSHVIQGARRAEVTTLDGRSLSGRVLGDDPDPISR